MKLIASCVMILIGLLFIGVAMLKNRKSHWLYATLRTVAVVVAAVLSVLMVNLVCGLVANALYNSLEGSALLKDFQPLFERVPSFADVLRAVVGCVLAVILFVPVFAILKGILYLVVKPIAGILIPMVENRGPKKAKAPRKKKAEEAKEESAEEAAEEQPKKKEKRSKSRGTKAAVKGIHTKEPSLAGMLIGALCGLFVFVATFAPLVGILTVVDDVVSLSVIKENEEDAKDREDPEDEAEDRLEKAIVLELADAAANNVGSKTVRVLGGTPIFSGLTSYRVGEYRMSLVRETRFVTLAGGALILSANEDADHVEAAEMLRDAGDAFGKTDVLPVLIPELMHAASEDWDKGQKFCGIAKPSFGAGMDVFLDPFMDILADSTYGTVKEDVKTLFDLMATVVEKDAMARLSNDPILLFEDREFSASLLKSLLENPRMCRMVDGFLTFGLETMGKSFGMHESTEEIYRQWSDDMTDVVKQQLNGKPASEALSLLTDGYARVFEKYGMKVAPSAATVMAETVMNHYNAHGNFAVDVLTPLPMADGSTVSVTPEAMKTVSVLVAVDQMDINASRVTDPAKEADALATVLARLVSMMDEIGQKDFSVSTAVRSLGTVLDDLAKTETLGKDTTEKLLLGLLQSKNVRESTGLSVLELYDITHTIIENAGSKGYATLLLSLSHTVDALNAANDPGVELSEKVGVLMENMTVESAKVLQQLAKPSLMVSNGVPEENAEASANMMSAMFGNLATFGENMTAEDYRREANAVTHVTNLAMSATSSQSETTFGEGSATGVTAGEYVNESLDSLVVSTTIRETVYPDGGDTPVADPLNTGMTLNDTERTEMLTALNERFATEADPTNAQVRQNYIAIGAMVNVPLVITDGGIAIQ